MSHFENRIKVNQIVKNQLPEFITADFPKAIEFLKQYYISQEKQGGAVDLVDNLDQYLNVKSLIPDALNTNSKLTQSISDDDTTIFVTSTKAFPDSYGLLMIDDEIITYTGKTSTSFTGCVRGFSGVTSYSDKTIITNGGNSLIFKSTAADSHNVNTDIINLSTLFLYEFYKKIKFMIAPGLENIDLSSDIDVSLFLANARSFFQSKGIEESIKILFKVLYGEDAKIIDLEEFVLKPSSANYVRRQVLVAEKLSGDDPSLLVGETLFSSVDPDITGSISEVDIITRSNKTYYQISLFIGYSDDIISENKFTLPGKSRVIGNVPSGSTVITVDTTIGFPDKGKLICGDNTIEYTSKSINQFFGCTGIVEDIADVDLIREDNEIFGYINGDITRKTSLRLTGVISNFNEIDKILSSEIGDKVYVRHAGYKVLNPEQNKNYTEIFANSWIYNTSSRYNVTSITNNTTFRLGSEIDKSSLKVGDKVSIYELNDLTPVYGGASGTILDIDTTNNTVDIANIPQFQSQNGVRYQIKRILKKTTSNAVQIDIGNNQYTSDITNVYLSENIGESYVASNSLPTTITNKNIVFYQIPNGSEAYLDDEISSDPGFYESIVFPVALTNFQDGDRVFYKADSPIIGLDNNKIYFIRKYGTNKIKLYGSPVISDLYQDTFIKLKPTADAGVHKFILARHASEKLSSNKILRKFPLVQDLSRPSSPIDDGEVAMMIDGVEISSPKSKDKIYYGPLESVNILNSGRDYDIVNPPQLTITSGSTQALIEPIIVGNVKDVLVDPQTFAIDNVFSVNLVGGNGSGCALEPLYTEVQNTLSFDSRNLNIGGGIDPADDTVTFTSQHNLDNGDRLIYDKLGNLTSIPLDGIIDGYNTLVDGASYYVKVINTSTVKLFRSKSDSIAGVNTVGITTNIVGGVHAFNTPPVRNLGKIRVVNPGSGYQYRKLRVTPVGVSTVENTITWKNHGFNNGDIVEYFNEPANVIVGLSTQNNYSIKKIDDDTFKLYDVGIGASIKTNITRDEVVNFKDAGTGTHVFKYPDITINAVVSYGSTVTGTINFTPVVTGEITDVYLYEKGSGYGSETLNFHLRPRISVEGGSGCQLRPIIENGRIEKVQVLSSGKNYSANPQIIVTDSGGGSGAILRPVIVDGKVTDVIVISKGISYNANSVNVDVKERGTGLLIEADVRSINLNDPYRFGQFKLTNRKGLNALTYSVFYYDYLLAESSFNDDGNNHSPIIGWAYDGNPIYGPYGFSNPEVFGSTVTRLLSGYSAASSNIENRPSTSTFPLGSFVDDYSYGNGVGDLDEHNGRYCRTPEFPDGVYAYFASTKIVNGNISGEYPYFIGKTFRNSYIDDNKTLNQSFDFNTSKLSRNTFPYKVGDDNAQNDYIDESYESYTQLSEVSSITFGEIDDIKIINPGDGYKVGEEVVFTSSQGTGFKSQISKIKGKEIEKIETTTEEFTNLSFEWNSDKTVTIKQVPYSDLDVLTNDFITVTGLTTSISRLNNNSFVAEVENQVTNVSLASSLPENIDPLGSVDYVEFTRIPSFVSAGSSVRIGTEEFKVLNVYNDLNSANIERFGLGAGITATTSVTFIPDTIKINVDVNEFDSTHNRYVYFNANRSVGVGTTAGLTDPRVYKVGINTEVIGVPIRTIYLPNHGFFTGQELIFSKDPTVGVDALIVGNDDTATNTFTLPNLITHSDTVYAINKGPNYIGLATQVGLTTTDGLYFYTDGSDNFKYNFETNFTQINGDLLKILSKIKTKEDHNLSPGDDITLSITPKFDVGTGISTNKVNLHIDGDRLLVDRILFGPGDVSISNNTITITDHGLKDGEKVYYSAPIGGKIDGLDEGEYYVRYSTKDTINLCRTEYDVFIVPSNIDFLSTGGVNQELSRINPQIEITRNNNLVFDLSDESLTGYEFNIYYDQQFDSEFTSTNDTFNYNTVAITTTTIGQGDYLYKLLYSENIPDRLYYNVTKSGFINTADVNVSNYNQILYINDNFSGTYTITNVGSGKTFDIAPPSVPPKNLLTQTDVDEMSYTTSSKSVSGPIGDIQILTEGFGYKGIPIFEKVNTENGKNANVSAVSQNIGQIQSVRIIDGGFEYSPDRTLNPEASVPYPVELTKADSVSSIEVIDGGSNYVTAPDLVLVNDETREVIDTTSFNAITGSTISSVELLAPIYGIPDSSHTLFAINNSNGISISSVTSAPNSGIVTCTLVTPLIGFSTSLFTIGQEIFVENIQNIPGDPGLGCNSTDYGYRFFEVTDYINSNPAIVKFKIADELNPNPGLAKTFQLGYAQIIPKSVYPTFSVIQERKEFSQGEKIYVSRDGGDYNLTDLTVSSARKDYLKVYGTFELFDQDKIRGSVTGNKGVVSNPDKKKTRSKLDVDFSTLKNLGWSNDTGKTSDYFQRLPDNDYYQNLSYTIKTKIPFEECIVPVNRVVHPAGLKNFVDVGITSSINVGLGTDVETIGTTIILDVLGERRVDTFNGFDFGLEVDVLQGKPLKSKYVQAKNTRFTDFVTCKTNRAIQIDDISQLFTNKQAALGFINLDDMIEDYARYLIQVRNPDTNEVQLSEVLATNSSTQIFTSRRSNLFSDTTSGTSNGQELGDIFGYFPTQESDIELVFKPVEQFDSDYDVKVLRSFHSLSSLGIGTQEKYSIGDADLISSNVGVGSTTSSLKLENAVATFDRNTFGSAYATLFIEDNVTQEHRIVDYSVFKIGDEIYDGQFYVDNNEFSYNEDDVVGIVTTTLSGSDDLEIKVINNLDYTNLTVRSHIIALPQSNGNGISTYYFTRQGQPNSTVRSARFETVEVTGFTGITSIRTIDKNITSVLAHVQVSAGSTIALHRVSFVNDFNYVYSAQYPFLSVGSASTTGIGTFGGSVGSKMNLNFYPDIEYVGTAVTVQAFMEMFYDVLDFRNIPEDLDYGTNSTSLSNKTYDAVNGSRAVKKDFEITYNTIPIFKKSFLPNASVIGIDTVTNEAIFTLNDHFFNTGEELVYKADTTFINDPVERIGIGATLDQSGIVTTFMPSVVYPIVIDGDKFKLVTREEYITDPTAIGVTVTSYGRGSDHSFEMTNTLTKAVISLDGIVQQPISFTAITHAVEYNDSPVSIAATFFALSGISSVQPRDVLKINDEYMKVVEIGLSTAPIGPIGRSIAGIAATIPTVGVERGILGTNIEEHEDGDIVRVYRGSYDLLDSRVYFLDAPTGNARDELDESDLPYPTSSFDGRVFTRASYDTNIIFDDISDSFTGIGKTYTITSLGFNTTGLSNGNGLVFINGIFQTPTTSNNIGGNYELVVDNTLGISSIVFSGITSEDGTYIKSDFDINQNQVPRGGLIVSLGSTSGSGYAPLKPAIVGLVTGSSGQIVDILVQPSTNRSFGIQTAAYDNETGILDITTEGPNIFEENDLVKLSDLEFECAAPHAGVTTTIFPDGSSPSGFTFPILTKYTNSRFTLDVGVSTIPHTYVGFGSVYEYLSDLNVGSAYRGGSVSVAVSTGESLLGSGAEITATVGLGGTITFTIVQPGSGYFEPHLDIPTPSYDNLEIVGVSRLSVGNTTDTGKNLLMSLEIGPNSNPIFEDRYADAANLIEANAQLIAEVAVGRMLTEYPVFTIPGGNQNCIDDIVDVLNSISYNLRYGGNDYVFDAANYYVTGAHVAGEEEQSIYAFEEARTMAIEAMRNEQITIGGYSSRTQIFDYSIIGDQSQQINDYNPGDCADVASSIDSFVGIVTNAIDSGSLPPKTVAPGSLNEVSSFRISRPGYSFQIGDKFTVVGLVTDARLSEPAAQFELEVVQVFNDFFAGWQFGELDYIDSIKNFQDGTRTRFPLYYNGELVSFEKDPSNVLSQKIDLNAILLIFINGVIQTPNISYLYEGGTSINFSRPPDVEDKVDIFFYVGDKNVDVIITDIRETIKKGDTILLKRNPNNLGTEQQDDERTVFELPLSDTIETNIYVGQGIEEVYKPFDWVQQKRDLIINGDIVSKARRILEPRVYPTAKVIGDIDANSTNIFVDEVRHFFLEEELYGETIQAINGLVMDPSVGIVGAEATVTVSAGGTISAVTITNSGSGYKGTENISVSGIGTSAELSLVVSNGSVTGVNIVNPGIGYDSAKPPNVLIGVPAGLTEEFRQIQLFEGFAGIITGITTSAGTGGHPIALNFFFRSDISDANDLNPGYPVLIQGTTIGEGVTSVESGTAIIGIGQTFLDNVYYVNSKFNVGPICDITCNVLESDGPSLETIVGTGITGDYLGRMSWGRLFNYGQRVSPKDFTVSGHTVDVGLSTFPTIQRRGYGFFNNGSIAID
jgi:hypothetical protein